jgi:hypothetical protein
VIYRQKQINLRRKIMKKRILCVLIVSVMILTNIPMMPAAASEPLVDFSGNCEFCGEELERVDLGGFTIFQNAGMSGSPSSASFNTPGLKFAGWRIHGSASEYRVTPVTIAQAQAAKYLVLEVARMEEPIVSPGGTHGGRLISFAPEEVYDGQGVIRIPLAEVGDRASIITQNHANGFIGIWFWYGENTHRTVADLGITAAYLIVRDDCVGHKVATPVISPTEDRFPLTTAMGSPYRILLVTETRGASIYYTLDGSTPSSLSTLHRGREIQIRRTSTLRAIAIKEGMEDSDIMTAFIPTPGDEVLRNRFLSGSSPTGGITETPPALPPEPPTPVTPPAPVTPLAPPHEFTTRDALNILRYVAGLADLTAEQRVLYDRNNDGVINTADALEILKIIAGL